MRDSAPIDPGQTVKTEGGILGEVIGYDAVDDEVAVQWRSAVEGKRVTLVPADEIEGVES